MTPVVSALIATSWIAFVSAAFWLWRISEAAQRQQLVPALSGARTGKAPSRHER